jgi:hypothetical protein
MALNKIKIKIYKTIYYSFWRNSKIEK